MKKVLKTKKVLVGGLVGMMMGLAGCQTVPYEGQARDVKRKPQEEGVISIPLNFRDEDRMKAESKMKSNCAPSSFKVLEEGEVAVGETTSSSGRETDRASTERKVGSLFGMPLMSGEAGGKNTENTSTTTKIKEWQISYKCTAASGGAKKSKVE